MSTATHDRLERTVQVRAKPARVWRLLTDPHEFGRLFSMRLAQDAFTPGDRVETEITHPAYEGVTGVLVIERVDPESRFCWRWHPNAVERDVDYAAEPMTLVEVHLEPLGEDTEVKVTESGFDRLPEERRASAYEANNRGWAEVLKSLERVVGRAN
jgi:uncharacterized protein YndB with AHSA1/START domain